MYTNFLINLLFLSQRVTFCKREKKREAISTEIGKQFPAGCSRREGVNLNWGLKRGDHNVFKDFEVNLLDPMPHVKLEWAFLVLLLFFF